MTKYYKLVDIKNEEPFYLFHGVDRSKQIPVNKWIKADKKLVQDGSSGTKYLSGFHVLKTKKEAIKYLKKFKHTKKKGIAECYCKGLREKEHSRDNVWLADEMKLIQYNYI